MDDAYESKYCHCEECQLTLDTITDVVKRGWDGEFLCEECYENQLTLALEEAF